MCHDLKQRHTVIPPVLLHAFFFLLLPQFYWLVPVRPHIVWSAVECRTRSYHRRPLFGWCLHASLLSGIQFRCHTMGIESRLSLGFGIQPSRSSLVVCLLQCDRKYGSFLEEARYLKSAFSGFRWVRNSISDLRSPDRVQQFHRNILIDGDTQLPRQCAMLQSDFSYPSFCHLCHPLIYICS